MATHSTAVHRKYHRQRPFYRRGQNGRASIVEHPARQCDQVHTRVGSVDLALEEERRQSLITVRDSGSASATRSNPDSSSAFIVQTRPAAASWAVPDLDWPLPVDCGSAPGLYQSPELSRQGVRVFRGTTSQHPRIRTRLFRTNGLMLQG